jgi:selenocysteine lyase/cysteine desulfurase
MGRTGVLVAKKKLFKNKVPNGSGGGAVFFVSRKEHRYLKVNISSYFFLFSSLNYFILNIIGHRTTRRRWNWSYC